MRPMAASTANDASPPTNQNFRERRAVGGGFGTSTTGATGSIRAVSIPTGLFMCELRLRPPARGTLADGAMPP